MSTVKRFDSARFRPHVAGCAAVTLIMAVSLYFLFNIYPSGDDGWYELMKVQGVENFGLALKDRLLTSSIYEAYEWIAGGSDVGIIVVHIILWVILAAETHLLCVLIFSDKGQAAYAAALLVLSPIIVKSSVVTITYDSATIVPVVVAYGGILLCIWSVIKIGPNKLPLALGFGLCFLAGLISEYGFCAAIAGGSFLALSSVLNIIPQRKSSFLTGSGILVVCVTSYLLFSIFLADLDPSSTKNIFQIFRSGIGEVFSIAVSWLTHIYQLNLGSVFREMGNLKYELDSKSSLLALALGCVVAGLIWPSSASKVDSSAERSPRLYLAIVVATATAIFPFMFAGRSVFEHYLNTRYFIAGLPFAAIGVMVFVSLITTPKSFKVAVIILAFLTGSVSVTFLSNVRQHARELQALGSQLQPLVGNNGITVFVLGRHRNSAISLSGKVTEFWADEARAKTWVMPDEDALIRFGKRSDCMTPQRFDLDHRGLLRRDSLHAVYFVDQPVEGQATIEAYCKQSGRQPTWK